MEGVGGGEWVWSRRTLSGGRWCQLTSSNAFGKSTSQRIYPKQHTPKIG